MTATAAGYSPAPSDGQDPKSLGDAASVSWVRRVVDVINSILTGKLNSTLVITLTSGAASTVIKDARIGPFSYIGLQPLTAHAAADLYSATSVLTDETSRKNGQLTLNHPNNANADKTFRMLIIG